MNGLNLQAELALLHRFGRQDAGLDVGQDAPPYDYDITEESIQSKEGRIRKGKEREREDLTHRHSG
jgi:hypothetical protein